MMPPRRPRVARGAIVDMSVGVLVGGLVFGWLRSVDRRFGRIPEATLWLFDSVGLAAFLAHPGVLLGVCAGAATSAPGLAVVQEVARSKIPTLGYGVTYAIGNVLLALWGSVMVVLMAG